MVRRTGQMGVPVTVIDGQAVVGFDRPRLEALLAARPKGGSAPFGAAVKPVAGGVLVGRVRPASVADAAGLRVGDVLTRVGDHPITDAGTLVTALAVGAEPALTVLRNGQELTLRAHGR